MILARLLGPDRDPLEVYCRDGEQLSKGTLVVRSGGGVMFEPDLLGEAATPPVRPGAAHRGEILDAKRKPYIVHRQDGDSLDRGRLVVRPGGVVLFEPLLHVPVDEAESHEEDVREARRQARREGTDPRAVAPAA